MMSTMAMSRPVFPSFTLLTAVIGVLAACTLLDVRAATGDEAYDYESYKQRKQTCQTAFPAFGLSLPICRRYCGYLSSCDHGGYCNPGGDCLCPPRYRGTQCKTDRCSSGTCYCPRGLTGKDCTEPVGCTQACLNGGTCISETDQCLCRPGWTGGNCGQSACAKQCANGGSCVGTNSCQCQVGWAGDQCQTSLCTAGYCQNGGSCIGTHLCRCRKGFTGSRCENKAQTMCTSTTTGRVSSWVALNSSMALSPAALACVERGFDLMNFEAFTMEIRPCVEDLLMLMLKSHSFGRRLSLWTSHIHLHTRVVYHHDVHQHRSVSLVPPEHTLSPHLRYDVLCSGFWQISTGQGFSIARLHKAARNVTPEHGETACHSIGHYFPHMNILKKMHHDFKKELNNILGHTISGMSWLGALSSTSPSRTVQLLKHKTTEQLVLDGSSSATSSNHYSLLCFKLCLNAGNLNPESGHCDCGTGYTGKHCEVTLPPPVTSCKNGGTLDSGQCTCRGKYSGPQCQYVKCDCGTGCKYHRTFERGGGGSVSISEKCKCIDNSGQFNQPCDVDECNLSCSPGQVCKVMESFQDHGESTSTRKWQKCVQR
ncbi:sushi, nidogen and EGF-like domain-containing protein 1 [Sycon ciliatum]|uniref:sushi, nidogen and EGF-like domain-containing protein 1 n=1 Tax=Sycon ciliatum TaxID=27933 RepID=UPI0031F715CD